MAIKIVLLGVCFLLYAGAFAKGESCREKLKNLLPMTKCCKMPEMIEESEVQAVVNDFKKKYPNNPMLLSCMINQELIKKLGLAKLDKTECKEFMQKKINGQWLPISEGAVDTCIDGLPKYAPIYQNASNLTKDQCDMQYSYIIDCTHLEIFKKCLADSWTSSEKCENSKKFATECEGDESFADFFHMH